MADPVYLDYNATTPLAPEVLEAVVEALRNGWGNPSSAHPYGRAARDAVDLARHRVADAVGVEADEVIFTSGGTESDNAAIFGVAEARADQGRHIVISSIEHAAVERPCAWLESRGFEVTRVEVDASGRVEPDRFCAAFRDDTILVSLMHANNETGVIQPVQPIADRARARGIVVHCDAAQSVGKVAVDVDSLGVDLLTLAGHKVYAPKGVGALIARRNPPLRPYLLGAPHERGLRAGTENTPGIVGLGVACEAVARDVDARERHLAELRDRLVAGLRERLDDVVVHGEKAPRLPNTASLALPGREATSLLARIPEIAAGSGAACHSGRPTPSRVLQAMGIAEELAICTLRLTLGCPTTADEVDRAVERIVSAA